MQQGRGIELAGCVQCTQEVVYLMAVQCEAVRCRQHSCPLPSVYVHAQGCCSLQGSQLCVSWVVDWSGVVQVCVGGGLLMEVVGRLPGWGADVAGGGPHLGIAI